MKYAQTVCLIQTGEFPGGPVVKNLPASAEDTQLLSAAATESRGPRACALQQEKPSQ